jgi:membrane protein YqaA with SNARE-associated domain
MGDLLSVFGVGVLSALVPLVNIEAYLGVRGSVGATSDLWLVGFAAGLGQMIGKLAWYYLGARALDWGWVRRKLETAKAEARLEKWRARTDERPWVAGGLVAVSAFTGFPPFAIVAVVAGQLRMRVWIFFTLGVVGRTLRFAAVLGGAEWLSGLIR